MENIRIVKEKYIFEYQNGYFLLFTPDYNKLAKFPLSTKLTFNNNTICEADGTAVLSGDTLTISYENLPKLLHNVVLKLLFWTFVRKVLRKLLMK